MSGLRHPVFSHKHTSVPAKSTYAMRRQTYESVVKIRVARVLRTSRVLGLATASAFVLGGCTSMKIKLGWKVYLAQTPVASIDASLPNGPGIAPGQKSPLVVKVTEPNGKVLSTEGKGQGPVMWKDLRVTASVVRVNQKGIVSLPRDPRISDGKVGHVTITVPSHPDMCAELDIPFRYDVNFVANFSGSSGSSGLNGIDGISGIAAVAAPLTRIIHLPAVTARTAPMARMAKMEGVEATRRRFRSGSPSDRETIHSFR